MERQYWRIFVSIFSHVHPIHLCLNVILIWECRELERNYIDRYDEVDGRWRYIRLHGLIALLSTASSLCIDRWLISILRRSTVGQSIRRRYMIGYSPIVFGCIYLFTREWDLMKPVLERATIGNDYAHDVIVRRGYELFDALSLVPFLALFCAQVLLDHTSFVANMSGLAIAVVVWRGVFDWLNTYWVSCYFVWIAGAVCVSVSGASNESVPSLLRILKRHVRWTREAIEVVRVLDVDDERETRTSIPMYGRHRRRRRRRQRQPDLGSFDDGPDENETRLNSVV